MKTIGYVRVSTEDQATDGVSLEAQKAKLQAYASLYDLELVEIIVDAGESAKSLNRPGIQRCLAMLKKGTAEALLVAKLDRLTRSVRDLGELVESYFAPGNSALMSVSENIDTRSAAGRLVLNVLTSVAQWEREAIGERTADALRHKKANGERVGKVPFGFDLAADGRTLSANAREHEVIGLIRELNAHRRTLREIAAELTRRSIQTKEGKTGWTHTAINRILKRSA